MRPLPLPMTNIVNTIRSDIDAMHATLLHLGNDAARLRTFDDRTLHDVTDTLKAKVTARMLDWFESGALKDAVGLSQTPISPSSAVSFPEPPKVNPS